MKKIAVALFLLFAQLSTVYAYTGQTPLHMSSHRARTRRAPTMAEAITLSRTAASIPARQIPITGTATTTTGELATATAFTSCGESIGRYDDDGEDHFD
jgi:hypothetical protein